MTIMTKRMNVITIYAQSNKVIKLNTQCTHNNIYMYTVCLCCITAGAITTGFVSQKNRKNNNNDNDAYKR